MRRRTARSLAFLCAALLAAAPAPAADPGLSEAADAPKRNLSIGVAPFERVGPAASEAPDVALLLADRLATRGVGVVVGPAKLGAPAQGRPGPEDVRRWASAAGVGAIVVGRATQLGRRTSLDVQLRSGASGASEGTFVEEAAGPQEIVAAVDKLAARLVEGLERIASAAGARRASPPQAAALSAAPAAPVSTAPPAAGPGRAAGGALDLGSLRRDKPISIQSTELEAIQGDGRRRFVFTGNVRVTQEDMSLRADRLEAFYPEGGSQPERLVARGHVVVTQNDRRASCDEATYVNAQQRVICRGNAEMQQGSDRVRGKEIELHLDTRQLFVRGGAEVRITPKPQGGQNGGGA